MHYFLFLPLAAASVTIVTAQVDQTFLSETEMAERHEPPKVTRELPICPHPKKDGVEAMCKQNSTVVNEWKLSILIVLLPSSCPTV